VTPPVEARVGPCEAIVEICGVPHLILRRADISGIQSWIKGLGTVRPYFCIEIATRHGKIVCDYERRDLWEEILRKLADAKIFNDFQEEPTR
jgi:hypothetical protein